MIRALMIGQSFVAGIVVKDGWDNGTVAPVWIGIGMFAVAVLVLSAWEGM